MDNGHQDGEEDFAPMRPSKVGSLEIESPPKPKGGGSSGWWANVRYTIAAVLGIVIIALLVQIRDAINDYNDRQTDTTVVATDTVRSPDPTLTATSTPAPTSTPMDDDETADPTNTTNITNASNASAAAADEAAEMDAYGVYVKELTKHVTSFLTFYTDPKDSTRIYLEIPQSMMDAQTMFVGSAIFGKGTFVSGSQVTLYHMPAETEDDACFQLTLSDDGTQIVLHRPNLMMRTTDDHMLPALETGAWSGWTTRYSVLKTRVNTTAAHLLEGNVGNDTLYLISGRSFFTEGFYTARYSFSTSLVASIKAYPDNVVITGKHMVGSFPIELVYSLTKLPSTPMPSRVSDDRLGYFTTNYKDMGYHYNKSSHPKHAASMIDSPVSLINRKRPPNDGPLIYYIDPSVPQEWRVPLAKGVQNWRPAFEALGYGAEAITAILPGDPSWPDDYDAGDVRYSTISWAIDPDSTFAIGPSTVDPRSGEIINSDIVFTQGWIHAWMGKLDTAGASADSLSGLNNDAATDYEHEHGHGHGHGHGHADREIGNVLEKALGGRPTRKAKPCGCSHPHAHSHGSQRRGADVAGAVLKVASLIHDIDLEEVIHAGLSDVAQHEVGHTLGLRHNFKGSSARTWSQSGDVAYVAQHGLTSSVMDYLPVNLRTGHPTDASLLFTPKIGEYDMAAIRYGYGTESDMDRQAWVDGLELAFSTDEDGSRSSAGDQLASTWDVSDDPVRWYTEQMRVVRSLRTDLLDRVVSTGESFTGYADAERTLLNSVLSAGYYVAKAVGGYVASKDHKGTTGVPAVSVVETTKQQQALSLLLDVLSDTGEGEGLFANETVFKDMVERGGWCRGMGQTCLAVQPYDVVGKTQRVKQLIMSNLLSRSRMERLVMTSRHLRDGAQAAAAGAAETVITVMHLLKSVVERVWGTDRHGLGLLAGNPTRWDVQTYLVELLLSMAQSTVTTEVKVAACASLHQIRELLDDCFALSDCAGAGDEATTHYLNITLGRITKFERDSGWSP